MTVIDDIIMNLGRIFKVDPKLTTAFNDFTDGFDDGVTSLISKITGIFAYVENMVDDIIEAADDGIVQPLIDSFQDYIITPLVDTFEDNIVNPISTIVREKLQELIASFTDGGTWT